MESRRTCARTVGAFGLILLLTPAGTRSADSATHPKVEIGVLLVNGRHVNLDHCPDGGDVLAIFPVIGGG